MTIAVTYLRVSARTNCEQMPPSVHEWYNRCELLPRPVTSPEFPLQNSFYILQHTVQSRTHVFSMRLEKTGVLPNLTTKWTLAPVPCKPLATSDSFRVRQRVARNGRECPLRSRKVQSTPVFFEFNRKKVGSTLYCMLVKCKTSCAAEIGWRERPLKKCACVVYLGHHLLTIRSRRNT